VVIRTLAEEPGLRGAATEAELVAGLVALRAYCAGDRPAINRALRTGENADRPAVIARGAAFGMRCLPAVLGPVFRPARLTPEQLAAYRPGQDLIEPGFLDVDLLPTAAIDDTAEFAIWSVSARRLGKLGGSDIPAAALFPPGTRLTVLAVDDAGAKPRILLADSAAGTKRADRILARLRDATFASAQRSAPGDAPGLDDRSRPYALA
jgi:hypothetical protein